MFDALRFSDFGFRLEDYLLGISQSLRNRSYHPKPLQKIDVPKSTLSVRPGSVLSIEDKIVFFAIIYLISPRLDPKLPENVYSWRLKDDADQKTLFKDHELLRFPFLKRRTIQREIEMVEPWYGVWPAFIEDIEIAYEEEGYKYLVVSDIVSYFENLDLTLLRELLLNNLLGQGHIINFLLRLLEYWAWPGVHGSTAPRGIPQGNAASSFLGNFYLLPLDKAFLSFSKRRDIKYLRYMDDVQVLAREEGVAREALFLMNNKLRELRLNIQGAKTRILRGAEISEELFDGRLDQANDIVTNIQKKPRLTVTERDQFVSQLKGLVRKVKGRAKAVSGKELRLFRRIMTGFMLLRHPGMLRQTLDQLERNPDSRLLNSAVRYFRVMGSNRKQIIDRIVGLLEHPEILFHYQTAHFFMGLRYARDLRPEVWNHVRRAIRSKSMHWYVRQQAVQLFALKRLTDRQARAWLKFSDEEGNAEVRRAWIGPLAQLDDRALWSFVQKLVFSTDTKLQRAGRFLYELLRNEQRGLEHIDAFFHSFSEDMLTDRLFELEILSKSRHEAVKKELLRQLRRRRTQVRKPILRERVDFLVDRLKVDAGVSKPRS